VGRTIRCPYCGARFTAPEDVSVAVCPYCGTAVWQSSGDEIKDHYIYDDILGYDGARDAIRDAIQRQDGVPEDIGENLIFSKSFLHYIPLHLYHVKVRASCPGSENIVLIEEYKSLLASKNTPVGVSKNYKFPVRGWSEFHPRILDYGIYHQVEVDPEKLKRAAGEKARRRAVFYALNGCDEPHVEDETHWEGIIHYPIWETVYIYRNRKYRALIDATNGMILYLEYPIASEKTSIRLGLATAMAVGGLILGTLIGGLASQPFMGALGGLAATLPATYPIVREKRITGVYRLEPEYKLEEDDSGGT